MPARATLHSIALAALVAAALAACGPEPTPQAGPTPLPTPSDGAAPTPTPAGLAQVAPELLGDAGRATAVNGREWIVVVTTTPNALLGYFGKLVLPPDHPPGATLPTLACFGGTLPDGSCFHEENVALDVSEPDRIYGVSAGYSAGGLIDWAPALWKPGELILLLITTSPPPPPYCGPRDGRDLHLGPEAQVFGLLHCSDDPQGVSRPGVWTSPAIGFARLPTTGFDAGPRPEAADASGRIAASGVTPELPAVWRPAGDSLALDRLPLLDGGSRGGALAIDEERIVGWSDDGSSEQAVVWTGGDGSYAVQALPVPDGLAACTRATGTSGARVVGNCVDAQGSAVAAAWRASGSGWVAAAVLEPRTAAQATTVTALSGDLAVGYGTSGAHDEPLAWRLP